MSSKMKGWVVTAVVLAGGLPATAQAQVAVGSEFQVNTGTSGYQGQADLVVHDNGDFVVIWNSAVSSGTDTSGLSVQGQYYATDGTAVGGEFQANSYITGAQSFPTAAGVGDGSFIAVWDSQNSAGTDTSGLSVQARRFDTAGAPVGDDFQVNTLILGYQGRAEVDVGPSGEFAVVWVSSVSGGDDTGTRSIQARLFTAGGVALGPDFQVNSHTTGTQGRPAVAYAPDGTFVVAWQSDSSPGDDSGGYSIQARRFDAFGGPLIADFQANTYTSNDQVRPAVEVASDGSFIVTWGSTGSPGDDITNAVIARRFNALGAPVGNDFQVNTYTSGPQFSPDIAYGPDDDFLLTWESFGSSGTDGADFSVQARHFTAGGVAVGGEFQVNTYTTSFQVGPAIEVADDGRFVVAWQSTGSSGTDSDGPSAQAQRFATILFADGFESGDTTGWSVTVP